MSQVLKIGIVKYSGKKIEEVKKIELLSDKGVVGDRHFNEHNDSRKQITLIESENIDYYNEKFNTKISYLDFRRNIVTKDIKLNELINKKIFIGTSILIGKDLCRPCKHLQELLGYSNIVKEFLIKGGLRCKIINSGTIYLNNEIKI